MLRNLKGMDESIFSCLQCGYCESTCPVYDQIGWESVAPRGKIYYLKQLRNRGFFDRLFFRNKTFDPDFIKRLYQCAGCGAWEQVCHTGLKLQDLWMELKESLVQNNIPLPNGIPHLPSKINSLHSPYKESADIVGTSNRNGNMIRKYKLPKKADYVFFLGCTPPTFLNGLTESSLKILTRANVNFTLIEDEWCCSSVPGVTGYGNSNEFQTHAEHNLNKIKEIGAKTVISSCHCCGNYCGINNIDPELSLKMSINNVHEALDTSAEILVSSCPNCRLGPR